LVVEKGEAFLRPPGLEAEAEVMVSMPVSGKAWVLVGFVLDTFGASGQVACTEAGSE
jgi:hypothetical protein